MDGAGMRFRSVSRSLDRARALVAGVSARAAGASERAAGVSARAAGVSARAEEVSARVETAAALVDGASARVQRSGGLALGLASSGFPIPGEDSMASPKPGVVRAAISDRTSTTCTTGAGNGERKKPHLPSDTQSTHDLSLPVPARSVWTCNAGELDRPPADFLTAEVLRIQI